MKPTRSIAGLLLAGVLSCSKSGTESDDSAMSRERIRQIESGNPGEVFSAGDAEGNYQSGSSEFGKLVFKDGETSTPPDPVVPEDENSIAPKTPPAE